MEDKLYYTVEDVAELTGLTTRTIRNYLKSGALHGRKVGAQWRFTREEIEALFRREDQDTVMRFLQTKHTGAPAACAVVDLPVEDEKALAAILARVREKLAGYADPPTFQCVRDAETGVVRLVFAGDLKKVARLLRQLRKDEQDG